MDSATSNSTTDRLEVAGERVLTYPVTVAIAGVVKRGSVMGKITIGGEVVILDKDAVDGSEVPFCVLWETVDTTSEAKETIGAIRCSVNDATDVLFFAAGTVIAEKWDEMRALSMYAFPTTTTN